MPDDLNNIKIPLADLRVQIVQLMKEGFTEVPLGDFLLLLRNVYHKGDTQNTERAPIK